MGPAGSHLETFEGPSQGGPEMTADDDLVLGALTSNLPLDGSTSLLYPGWARSGTACITLGESFATQRSDRGRRERLAEPVGGAAGRVALHRADDVVPKREVELRRLLRMGEQHQLRALATTCFGFGFEHQMHAPGRVRAGTRRPTRSRAHSSLPKTNRGCRRPGVAIAGEDGQWPDLGVAGGGESERSQLIIEPSNVVGVGVILDAKDRLAIFIQPVRRCSQSSNSACSRSARSSK